jgi:hypothetical protein
MTALSPSGTRIAIRPSIATALDIWDSFAAGQLLKITASTATAAQILGVFNIAEGPREALLPLREFCGATSSFAASEPGGWVVRSYATGGIFVPGATPATRLAKLKLPTRGWDVFSVTPVLALNERKVSVLGLLDKISGAAAVTACAVGAAPTQLALQVKALGVLGVLVLGGQDRLPADESQTETVLQTVAIGGLHDADSSFITQQQVSAGMLVKIDLERAWTEKDLWGKDEAFEVRLDFTA